MTKYVLLLVALLGALAVACAQSDAPGAGPADGGDAPLGRGSGGPTARDEPIAESPGLIDTQGLPAFVFVDQDT